MLYVVTTPKSYCTIIRVLLTILEPDKCVCVVSHYSGENGTHKHKRSKGPPSIVKYQYSIFRHEIPNVCEVDLPPSAAADWKVLLVK